MFSLRVSIVSITLIVAAFAFAFAGPASATDYCVAPNTTCGGTPVGDLQTALDWSALSDNADRIFLGAGTYTAPAGGFSYDVPSAPVEIVGQSLGTTVLTGPAGGSQAVLKLSG